MVFATPSASLQTKGENIPKSVHLLPPLIYLSPDNGGGGNKWGAILVCADNPLPVVIRGGGGEEEEEEGNELASLLAHLLVMRRHPFSCNVQLPGLGGILAQMCA